MIFGAEFFDFFALHMLYITVGLIIIRLIKIPLGNFIPIYVALAVINVIVKQVYFPNEYLFQSIIVASIALAVLILLTGLAGTKISASNYQALVTGIGLFPWLHSWQLSVSYIILATVFVTSHIYIRRWLAFKSIGARRPIPMKEAEENLTEEGLRLFKRKLITFYAIPILIAAVISTVLFAS